MAKIIDVARYILDRKGEMGPTKLQKLCYYAQGWHLAWEGAPLIEEEFEAWKNGPVSRVLYVYHRKDSSIATVPGSASNLTEQQKCIIDAVLFAHGDKTGKQLSDMSHREGPWVAARGGIAPSESSRAIVSKVSIQTHFSAMANQPARWSDEPLDETLDRITTRRRELLKRLA